MLPGIKQNTSFSANMTTYQLCEFGEKSMSNSGTSNASSVKWEYRS